MSDKRGSLADLKINHVPLQETQDEAEARPTNMNLTSKIAKILNTLLILISQPINISVLEVICKGEWVKFRIERLLAWQQKMLLS